MIITCFVLRVTLCLPVVFLPFVERNVVKSSNELLIFFRRAIVPNWLKHRQSCRRSIYKSQIYSMITFKTKLIGMLLSLLVRLLEYIREELLTLSHLSVENGFEISLIIHQLLFILKSRNLLWVKLFHWKVKLEWLHRYNNRIIAAILYFI